MFMVSLFMIRTGESQGQETGKNERARKHGIRGETRQKARREQGFIRTYLFIAVRVRTVMDRALAVIEGVKNRQTDASSPWS